MKNINQLLVKVEKPARYIGGEYGQPKLAESSFNYCMCFPDLYEVGMSNLSIRIVMDVLNSVDGVACDRCFAPDLDLGKLLKENNLPLQSLGLKKPLSSFDMLGFTLQYEMNYTTILYMLDLANIPLNRADRNESHPIIQCGGPCAVNPEPLADFVDMFVIGDGEDSMRELAELKLQGYSKHEFLQKSTEIKGVYVPSLMDVKYNDNGTIDSFSIKTPIKKALVKDLENARFPKQMMVSNVEAVFDRAVVEVMRGCYRGCRFCQAGYIYRPVRKRSVNKLKDLACSLIEHTGFEELGLNSLSTGDYPHLLELIDTLNKELPCNTKLALPSLRIDSFDEDFARQSRISSLTFAPEAGTQRLRDVINKDITDEQITDGVTKAFNLGFSRVKLYFMMGLPTETEEDLQGIVDIVYKIKKIYATNPKRSRSLRISVSVSTFIPKPFTPFQWEKQDTKAEIDAKVAFLKSKLFIKGVTFSWNDHELSEIECVIARGDRKVGAVIKKAYELGCVFDGNTKNFNKESWNNAFVETGIDKDFYTRKIQLNENLAWDFIDIYVTKDFLLSERQKAYADTKSVNCIEGCKLCGINKEYDCKKC